MTAYNKAQTRALLTEGGDPQTIADMGTLGGQYSYASLGMELTQGTLMGKAPAADNTVVFQKQHKGGLDIA